MKDLNSNHDHITQKLKLLRILCKSSQSSVNFPLPIKNYHKTLTSLNSEEANGPNDIDNYMVKNSMP